MSRCNATFTVTEYRNTFNFNWVINKGDVEAIRKLHNVQDYLLDIRADLEQSSSNSAEDQEQSTIEKGPSTLARQETIRELANLFGKCSTNISEKVRNWEEDIYQRSVNDCHYSKLKSYALSDPQKNKHCREILDQEHKNIADFRSRNRNYQSNSSNWIELRKQKSIHPNLLPERKGEAHPGDDPKKIVKDTQIDLSKHTGVGNEEKPKTSTDSSSNSVVESSPKARKSSPIPIVRPPGVPDPNPKSVEFPKFTVNPLKKLSANNFQPFVPSPPPIPSNKPLKNWNEPQVQKTSLKPTATVMPVKSTAAVQKPCPTVPAETVASNSENSGESQEQRTVLIFDGKVRRYISKRELEEMRKENGLFGIAIMNNTDTT